MQMDKEAQHLLSQDEVVQVAPPVKTEQMTYPPSQEQQHFQQQPM